MRVPLHHIVVITVHVNATCVLHVTHVYMRAPLHHIVVITMHVNRHT